MPQENVEIVRRHFEATNRRDFATAMHAYAKDVVLVVGDAVVPTNAGTFTGREAVGDWFGDWFRSFDQDYRFEVEDIRSLGDYVLVVARHHGHGRASGVALDWSVVNVYTVRAGRIVRVELFSDRAEA